MIAYADTSFLVSLYGNDPNAIRAVREFQQSRPTVLITPFNELEFVTAFEAIVFRKIASTAEVEATIRAFHSDIEIGALRRHSMPVRAFEQATSLSRRYTKTLGCRTLDILHVGIAVELEVEAFLTFDKEQGVLARHAGLTVRPGR